MPKKPIKIEKTAVVDVFAEVPAEPKGLFFTQAQLNEIALCFGESIIKSPQDLIDKLKRSQELRFDGGVTIDLTTDDLHSLKQQSIGMSTPYEEYVKKFVGDAIKFELMGWRR